MKYLFFLLNSVLGYSTLAQQPIELIHASKYQMDGGALFAHGNNQNGSYEFILKMDPAIQIDSIALEGQMKKMVDLVCSLSFSAYDTLVLRMNWSYMGFSGKRSEDWSLVRKPSHPLVLDSEADNVNSFFTAAVVHYTYQGKPDCLVVENYASVVRHFAP